MVSKDEAAAEELKGQQDLSHAGAVVDKAIEHLLEQQLDPLAIASALLAGSLGLLTQTVGEEATVQVLNSAVASVQAGDLRPGDLDGDDEDETEDDKK